MAKRSRSKVLLFLDLLGTRAAEAESLSQIQRRLNLFAQTVGEGINEAVKRYAIDLVSVDIESDAAALRFATPSDAVLAGMALFSRAFAKTYDGERDAEMAFRGVITFIQDSRPLRADVPLSQFPEVNRVRLSSSFLQAILLEKSGLKGARLAIPPTLLSQGQGQLVHQRIVDATGISLDVCCSLDSDLYPSNLTNWLDVLWPLHDYKSLGRMQHIVDSRLAGHRGNRGAIENLTATLEVLRASRRQLS